MGLTKASTGIHAMEETDFLSSRRTREKIIALAGNPNVGKSTVFNVLTGGHQHTGNWPGKTVTSAHGVCRIGQRSYRILDLPGSYSLTADSAEEEVTRDYILKGHPDLVIAVCDATCLERSLLLALRILEQTPAVILCVNLMDEAAKKGIRIDTGKLSERLGIPVIPTAARSRRGIKELRDAILHAAPDSRSPSGVPLGSEQLIQRAHALCDGVVTFSHPDYNRRSRKADALLTSKWFGIPLLFLLLFGILWLTISGANVPSQLLANGLFALERLLFRLLSGFCPKFLTELLVHGAYRTLAWVVSVMLPPMALFFPLFTLLEDSGYLPRIAFNMDACFHRCHACGKQALTMCMGMGCNAAGVIGCRIIASRRERLIAILTNSLVPCNGRFPTLIALISMFLITSTGGILASLQASLWLSGLLLLGVFATLAVSLLLAKTLLRGIPSSFLLELPPYRHPQIGKVIVRSIFDRTLFVLGRAAIVALPAGILLWLLGNLTLQGSSLFALLSDFLDPFARFLGLDGVILLAFLLGFPANEIVIPIVIMGYLSSGTLMEYENLSDLRALFLEHGWTIKTAFCTMLFMLFHFPCSTTVLTVYKETKRLSYTLLSIALPLLLGVFLCALTNLLFTWFG